MSTKCSRFAPNRSWFKTGAWRCLIPIALATLVGCGTTSSRTAYTMTQVIQLSRAGVPPADLVAQLRETRTILPVTGSQYAQLKEQGVSDEVLDYMQKTYVAQVEADARWRARSTYYGYGYGYYPYGYGYRYPYYGHGSGFSIGIGSGFGGGFGGFGFGSPFRW